MFGEGEGLQQLPPSAGFSSLCLILGSLRRDLGPSAVVLLIPECVFHRSLCVQTLGPGFASLSTGKGLKALTTGGILECFLPCVWDRVCSAEGLAARGKPGKGQECSEGES